MTTTPGFETTIGVLDATSPSEPRGTDRKYLERGHRVGRYQIIRMLGRGGMGAVYAALDTKLDRQIALKLLHSTHAGDGAERLIREAQALARLDDPHVVQVYDAGEHEGQVFIAMQLVDGEDLATALARKRASVAQIVSWFCAAGRGLAAAHAAGLVHRDFKPSNVLVDRRGRIAVTDFGLARSSDPVEHGGRPLTGLGTLMGTPAFMSPEQHAQLTATPASDQFSFCVALWQALYDRHPFIGDQTTLAGMSPFAIGYAIYDGELLPPPKRTRVPRRVHDALARGLSHAPAQRWPSLTALLTELAPAQQRSKWPLVIGVSVVVAAAAGGAAVWLALSPHGDAPASCALQTAQRVNSVWSTAQGQQLHGRFAKSGRSYAELSAQRTRGVLDRYATHWQQLAADVCASERAGTGALPELLLRRRACLDSRLDALRALTTLLVGEDNPEFVDRAPAMAEALPDLTDCVEDRLPTTPPAPIAGEVAKLSTEVDVAEARAIAGDFSRASQDAARILRSAEALAWQPLQARAHFVLGKVALAQFEPSQAREHDVKAAELATVLGLDRDAARAWTQAQLAAGLEHSPDAVASFASIARATAQRTKDKTLIAMAELGRARGLLRLRKWQDGADACKAAYTRAQTLDNHTVLDEARTCMLEALVPLGKSAEYEPLLAQLIADRTKELGPEHPTVADLMKVRVGLELRAGKVADARKTAEHVLEIRKRIYPAKHIKLAEAYAELASVADAEGKPKEALELEAKALAASDETRPEQVVLLSSVYIHSAMLENDQLGKEHHKKAVEYFEHALALVRKSSGPDSLELAFLLLNYGQVKSEDNVEAALGMLGEARRILEKNKDKRASAAGVGMAIVALNAKRYADARKYAEDTLAAVDASTTSEQIAHTKSVLARALWETGGDKKAARAMALDARARFQKLGPGAADSIKSLDTWLAKHR